MDDIVGSSQQAAAQELDAASSARDRKGRRPPPKAVQCVLPVWGYKFVRQFLEVGLPTLLAPGNIPALAAALPTRFVILTRLDDEGFIRHHPAFRRLSEVCQAEIRLIDHLITGSNYSTTITLGYTEAVRAAGDDMLDTCFVFLVSDYIVADGSLASVIGRMMDGASGVLVGNFQVAEEEAFPWLQEKLNQSPGLLAIPPRELLQWALNYLHPATVANTVNIPLSHNSHTNRLFWRVDGNTLLGRFYLMHMICVRPETTDFIIGSSCDYSFIPEMCPSNDVEVITDSDDYLVIEMQPRRHESQFLESGPLKPEALARTLSSWTTARHRENSAHSIVYHAKELPATSAAAVAEADRFIAQLRAFMTREPKPDRDHPYWRGAIAAHREATGTKLARDEWRRVLGLPRPENDTRAGEWLVEAMRLVLFGRPPTVRLCHPRWPDYHFIVNWLQGFLTDRRVRLLLAADRPTVFTASLADSGERVVRVKPSRFLEDAAEIWQPLAGAFDLCLVELAEDGLPRIGDLADRIAPLMKDGAEILVVVYNARGSNPGGFGAAAERHAQRAVRGATALTAVRFMPATRLRWRLQRTLMALGWKARSSPIIGVPLLVLAGGFLAFGGMLANAATMGRTKARLRRGKIATSFAFTLRVDGTIAKTASVFSADRIERQRQRRRLGLPAAPVQAKAWSWTPGQPPGLLDLAGSPTASTTPSLPPPGVGELPPDHAANSQSSPAEVTREAQYADCVEVKNRIGLTPLGLMLNQVWHDDPRRLTFVLARYKFVGKMLSGRSAVAEVGCGDAFGTRIVLQEVDRVDVYDFDPVFIEDVQQRQSQRWPMMARVHDIIQGELPHRYDGIYSLDVIEHIERKDEHDYVVNLRESLDDGGVLIIGSPSLESQQYASPQSKAGHVNCKSGKELKALMERYFHNVFLFSMNDEVVHTGFYPMAHYLIAVCCGKKIDERDEEPDRHRLRQHDRGLRPGLPGDGEDARSSDA
jgi:2-polyprenyl-3-methyl-5-hydroxy-6-metoxy-1,4-benzoquinol methylase